MRYLYDVTPDGPGKCVVCKLQYSREVSLPDFVDSLERSSANLINWRP